MVFHLPEMVPILPGSPPASSPPSIAPTVIPGGGQDELTAPPELLPPPPAAPPEIKPSIPPGPLGPPPPAGAVNAVPGAIEPFLFPEGAGREGSRRACSPKHSSSSKGMYQRCSRSVVKRQHSGSRSRLNHLEGTAQKLSGCAVNQEEPGGATAMGAINWSTPMERVTRTISDIVMDGREQCITFVAHGGKSGPC